MAWKDIAARVDTAGVRVFGDVVAYTPAGDVARDITGAFDAASEILDFVNGAEVVTTVPSLGVHLADLGFTPAKGDLVTIESIDYEVSEPPILDGPGVGALLRLQEI